jgi:hypothetical protein
MLQILTIQMNLFLYLHGNVANIFKRFTLPEHGDSFLMNLYGY